MLLGMEQQVARRNVSGLEDKRIGHIIRAERMFRRLSLAELATAVEIKHPTLANYEAGRRTIPRDRVEPLAKALGLDPRIIDPQAA